MFPNLVLKSWPRIEMPGSPGFHMRIPDEIQSTVVFIGFEDNTAPGGISCKGTGFLVAYEGGSYLVTARHIAEPIGDTPFLVRLNRFDGSGSNKASGDMVKWFHHKDETVDLSVIPFAATNELGYKCMYITLEHFASEDIINKFNIGVGGDCYTVGLFRYVTGKKANLPLVYSATISLVSDEKISCWNKDKKRKEEVDGYLIQSQGIHGASGSPVFVRPTVLKEEPLPDGTKILIQMQTQNLYLFGMVQGAWFLPPDAILRNEVGANQADSVPVGISIVVPFKRLVELLRDTKELCVMREKGQSYQLAQQISIYNPPM